MGKRSFKSKKKGENSELSLRYYKGVFLEKHFLLCDFGSKRTWHSPGSTVFHWFAGSILQY